MLKVPPFRDPADRVVRLEAWRRVVADGFDVAKKPDAFGIVLQDLLAAQEFRNRYRRQTQVPLTYLHMLVKACALALKTYPALNSMIARGKLLIPSSIDVGVTVPAEENIAPLVVIRHADTKSLKDIVRELQEKGRLAREQLQRDLETLNRIGRWLPPMVRRRLVAWALKDPTLRRRYVGTIQISILSDPIEFFVPMVLSTAVLLAMGRVAKRPVVAAGQLEARPTMFLSLALDHRILAGKHAVEFLKEVQRLLLQPEELER